eukprot:TCALIF_11320-PA protein Name:"Similar to cpg-2 Chondroitin proteoglycan 2 (Caenorhabditis briggsae)" AED:0.29 eAED:0.29 QI:0/0.2/0/0.83/0.6/0.5/6/0/405
MYRPLDNRTNWALASLGCNPTKDDQTHLTQFNKETSWKLTIMNCRSKTRHRPHEKYCDLYYHTTGCDDGQALLRSCPNGLVFTGTGRPGLMGVCDYPHNVECQGTKHIQVEQENPCQVKSKTVSDATYCDRYWECNQGDQELYDCPNGLVWVGKNRGIADGCDYPWRNPTICKNKDLAIHNKNNNNDDKEKQKPMPISISTYSCLSSSIDPRISTEHCDWLYGIFGHETSCTRYWTCWNGTATEQFCIGGLLYNEETHACDWPQNVVGCQKHPLCKDDPNGNVRLGKSCNRYWSCQGGYPRLQRCPAMLVFNHQLKRCVNPPTDDCSVPEQQPEEEDDGNDNNNSNNNNNNNNNDGEGNGQGNRRNQNNQDKRRGGDGQPRLSQQQLPKNFQLPEGATLLSRPSS